MKSIKDMQREKATKDDSIPADILKELGNNGLKIVTALVNKNYYKSGDWPKQYYCNIGANWSKCQHIHNLYMEQEVKLRGYPTN